MKPFRAVLGPSWRALEGFDSLLGAFFWAYWGHIGALLELSWEPIGALLGSLGAILDRIGALLGRLGALLEATRAVSFSSSSTLNSRRNAPSGS